MENIPATGSHCDMDMCPDVLSKLPKDLIIEFLRCLAKETLLEFRCVSKAYNIMISEYFLPKLASAAPVSGYVFQWKRDLFPELERRQKRMPHLRGITYPSTFHYGYVTASGGDLATDGGRLVESYLSLLPFKPQIDDFLGCFNGFFLVRNSSSIPIPYYVCNPVTKQCVLIPTNPAHLEKDSFVGLVFDPLDPPPHHFKIVRVACFPENTSSVSQQPHEMDIFSSATGKWVNHRIPLEQKFIEFKWNRRSIYVNGVFYVVSKGKYLLCFHLHTIKDSKLKAVAIELPPGSRDDCVGLFEMSNGCLYYASKEDDYLRVWTFHIDNEGSPWAMKYNINIYPPYTTSIRAGTLRKQTCIFAVDLSAEIIITGREYYAMTYEIKSKQAEFYANVNYGVILYDASLCFYPYSCCLVRLFEQFSSGTRVSDHNLHSRLASRDDTG